MFQLGMDRDLAGANFPREEGVPSIYIALIMSPQTDQVGEM